MSRVQTYAYRLLDATVYGAAAVSIAFVPLALLSFATGNGWIGVKVGLFLGGLLYGVVATWKLRPEPAHKQVERRHEATSASASEEKDGDDDGGSRVPDLGMGRGLGLGGGRGFDRSDESGTDASAVSSEHLRPGSLSDRESGIAGIVHSVPPLSLVGYTPESRASDGLRFLLTSLAMFGVSFAMEAVFRVGYGPA